MIYACVRAVYVSDRAEQYYNIVLQLSIFPQGSHILHAAYPARIASSLVLKYTLFCGAGRLEHVGRWNFLLFSLPIYWPCAEGTATETFPAFVVAVTFGASGALGCTVFFNVENMMVCPLLVAITVPLRSVR